MINGVRVVHHFVIMGTHLPVNQELRAVKKSGCSMDERERELRLLGSRERAKSCDECKWHTLH